MGAGVWKRAATFTVAMVAVVGLGVACTPDGTCESGEFCLYENNDYNQGNQDSVYEWVGDDCDYTNNKWYDTSSGSEINDVLDNEASSGWNRSSQTITLYQHVGCTGSATAFGAGGSDGFLENNAIGDNRASGHLGF